MIGRDAVRSVMYELEKINLNGGVDVSSFSVLDNAVGKFCWQLDSFVG